MSVYQLNDLIRYDTTYYNSKQNPVLHNGRLLGQKNIVIQNLDSVVTVRLSAQMGNEILSMHDSLFRTYFKGMYLTSGNAYTDAAVLKFSPLSSVTKMILYYQTPTTDSLKKIYSFYGTSPRLNLFEHDYTGTALSNLPIAGVVSDTVAYLSPMGGTRVKIELPYLNDYKTKTNGVFVLNRAELVVKLAPSTISGESLYPTDNEIILLGVKRGTNTTLFLSEFVTSSYYGGISLLNREYRVNLLKQIDIFMKGDPIGKILIRYG